MLGTWRLFFRAVLLALPFVLPACSLKSCLPSPKVKSDPIVVKVDTLDVRQIILLQAPASFEEDDETGLDQISYRTNLVGIGPAGSKPLLKTEANILVDFAQLSPDRKTLLVIIAPQGDGIRYMVQEQCNVFRITLASSQQTCLLKNYYTAHWRDQQASWNRLKQVNGPLQWDSAGNLYILAAPFRGKCSGDCRVGDGLDAYQRVENSKRQRLYVKNQWEIHKIESQGRGSFYTGPQNPLAFQLLETDKLALLYKDEGVSRLSIVDKNQQHAEFPVTPVNALLLDDLGNMLVNNQIVVHDDGNGNYSLLAFENTLRSNGNVRVTAENQLIDIQGKTVFSTLPFKVRPIAEFQASGSSLAFGRDYLFEKTSSGVLVHDLQNASAFELAPMLELGENESLVQAKVLENRELYVLVDDPVSSKTFLGNISLDSLVAADQGALKLTWEPLTTSPGNVIDALFDLSGQGFSSDGAFVVEQFSGFAENKQSLSIRFSQAVSPGFTDHVLLQAEDAQQVSYFPLQFGRYLHLLADRDGVANNSLTESGIAGQVGLESDKLYTLSVGPGLQSADGEPLAYEMDGRNYPAEYSIRTAPDSGTYYSRFDNFYQQFADLNPAVAGGGVVAKPVCTESTCSGFYYNLGISRINNLRIEFSSDSHFVQLALWDAWRHAQTYSRLLAPVYAFWADTSSVNLKNRLDTLTQTTDDAATAVLSDTKFWRRYRLDYYADTLAVSYSLDGESYTPIEALSVSGLTMLDGQPDDYFWLMEFDGALDNLQVSSLDDNGELMLAEGDVMQETFDEQIAFVNDDSAENGVGFEENIAGQLPLPSGAGAPDESFGQRGMQTIENTDGKVFQVKKLVEDAQGNQFLAGKLYLQPDEPHLAIYKYDNQGQVVADFGNNGYYLFEAAVSEPFAMVMDGNDRLLVAGLTHNGDDVDAALWCVDASSGQLAAGFGNGGWVQYATDNKEAVYGMALDSQDNIYLAGYTQAGVTVWKYTSNGTLDTGFNGGGILRFSTSTITEEVYAIDTDTADNVLLAAYQVNGSDVTEAMLYRIQPDGTVTQSLNINTALSFSGSAFATDISFVSDKILLLGYFYQQQTADLMLLQLNTDFSLDSSFAENGVWLHDSGGLDFGYRLQKDVLGRIYLLAMTGNAGLEIFRLDATGLLDQDFGRDGSIYKYAFAADMQLDDSGSQPTLVVSGSAVNISSGQEGSAVWRMTLQ